MSESKNILRSRMLAKRDSPVRIEFRVEASVLESRVCLAFLPMAGEPNITPYLLQRLSQRKTLCLPRLDTERKAMEAVAVSNLKNDTEPVPGFSRLRQPRSGLPAVDSADLDVALVPGLAFDCRGNRLGRGAGYYDRFLARLTPRTCIIGVCFDEQIVEDVPAEAHDVKMHALLTPSGLITISRNP